MLSAAVPIHGIDRGNKTSARPSLGAELDSSSEEGMSKSKQALHAALTGEDNRRLANDGDKGAHPRSSEAIG